MKGFATFVVALALGVVFDIAQAATLSIMWGWFLAPQYGPGPSYAGWFGVSFIARVLFAPLIAKLSRDPRSKLADEVTRTIGLLLGLGLMLGVAFGLGHLTGWL